MVSLTHLIISTLKKQFVDLSCQNWESLLGFVGIEDQQLVTASYSVVVYESNTTTYHSPPATA